MISIRYGGRFGNQLFQYAFARLLAEHLDLQIDTPWAHAAFPVNEDKSRRRVYSPEITLTEKNSRDIFDRPKVPAHYILYSYFQQADWYYRDQEKVRGFFKLPEAKLLSDDIAMHVRLTDYWHAWGSSRVIHPDWYTSILDTQTFHQLYIFTDDPLSWYHDAFKKYDPIIISRKNYLADFHMLRRFERLLCSNSTFPWWAAFLGNAKTVWTFKPWVNDRNVFGLTRFPGAIEVDGAFSLKGAP